MTRDFVHFPSYHSESTFPKSTNTSHYSKYSSLFYNSYFLDSPSSIFTSLGASKSDCLEQHTILLCCRIIILNSDIFLFTCRFIMISQLYKSCEYDIWEFFIYLLFSIFFYSPNLIVHDVSVFFHGKLHYASTIMSYVSIAMAFVTFNIVWGHINISCLNIFSIHSTIYNFMSKIITSKTITRKETLIPGRK
jgi:hypothetical protein